MFQIEKYTKIKNLSFGIVLTGGGSQLKNIVEAAENIFQSRIRIGKPSKETPSIEDYIFNPKYSTAIGIIKYAINHKEELSSGEIGEKRGFLKDFFISLKELFNN